MIEPSVVFDFRVPTRSVTRACSAGFFFALVNILGFRVVQLAAQPAATAAC
jgi:hypothetical protein